MPTDPRPDQPSAPAGLPSVEVAAVGETMVVLCPAPGEPLERAERVAVSVGGAESNVAGYLARLGHRTTWVSRVGDDPFGRAVSGTSPPPESASTRSAWTRPLPPACTSRTRGPEGTAVHYYRAGSAAVPHGPRDARPTRRWPVPGCCTCPGSPRALRHLPGLVVAAR